MKLISLNKNIKAFGLLESLVGIAVFGTSILIALSLVVNSLNIIQDNNIEDQASSIMINSLEYVKSPNLDIDLVKGLYALNYSKEDGYTGLIEKSSEPNETCSLNGEYFVENELNIPFCNYIEVDFLDGLDGSTLLIKSKIIYKTSQGFSTREIRGLKQT